LNSEVDRNTIAEKPELFVEELEKTFGLRAARVFETRILRLLCEKIDVDYSDIEGLTFIEAVKKALEEYSEAL